MGLVQVSLPSLRYTTVSHVKTGYVNACGDLINTILQHGRLGGYLALVMTYYLW